MFDDIGGKLKGFALLSFWVIVILCVIGGFSLMTTGNNGLAGILVMICGLGLAWESTAAIYAIGETAENSSHIMEQNEEIIKLLNKAAPSETASNSNKSSAQVYVWRYNKTSAQDDLWRCAKCMYDNPGSVSMCQRCGEAKEKSSSAVSFSQPSAATPSAQAAGTWKCSACGAQNQVGTTFCLKCGQNKS